jgi:hypothetical protein
METSDQYAHWFYLVTGTSLMGRQKNNKRNNGEIIFRNRNSNKHATTNGTPKSNGTP